GLSEDIRGLPVLARSLAQLAIALGVCLALLPGTGLGPWLSLGFVVYGVLFLSSFINVANFMDGLNGISGMHGVVAGITFALSGVLSELPWLTAVGAILAAAFAGFLPWNLLGRGVFLGDVGSYLLGGAVAATSLAALLAGVPVLATIAPMILYFGDSATTLVKRTRAGKKWYEPHKEHAYQRINQTGLSHLATSSLVAGLTALACALGLASYAVPVSGWWLLLIGGIALTAIYLRIPAILERRAARRSTGDERSA
ncbi:UDP-phosphate alpha-N-acetyl-D-fucosaminephosphotransferase, partial [Leucobacter sp. M11]|uniref:UDP-phosphate alpha-N-acetyl-D-fucosaminephosphotransferase n=1 Tax=Leucobacter sp. M11 TaxID=2993565 RepID=UPI002D809D2D